MQLAQEILQDKDVGDMIMIMTTTLSRMKSTRMHVVGLSRNSFIIVERSESHDIFSDSNFISSALTHPVAKRLDDILFLHYENRKAKYDFGDVRELLTNINDACGQFNFTPLIACDLRSGIHNSQQLYPVQKTMLSAYYYSSCVGR